MSELVKFENYSLTFKTLYGEVKALRNLSFTINSGEIVALVGETGCGKTVTALSIIGLLPENASQSGKIFFKGMEVNHENIKKIRGKEAAIVFQDPTSSLNPLYTVERQLVDVLTSRWDISVSKAREKVDGLLRQVQLFDVERIRRAYPHELSGGMRQRVMIAMALACEPSLLIADEPTTALDVTVQRQILYLIWELQKTRKFSVLFITHDLGIVAQLADRVVVMYAGNIVEMAPKKELFSNPMHPYTSGLLNCALDARKKRLPEPIPGSLPSLTELPDGCAFRERCGRVRNECGILAPELTEVWPNHFVACHLWGEHCG
ncbi:MAG: ABC transporter ATP-binding protein [Pseudothermotoga sp.]|uniref:ABC transporter ATP-binding protein n=1 Tax=Pseudothermotoga sp. TaxID=2033661 RepID=UPI000B25BA3A|nr:ABC transporter ATP-binding protein [Pseudothermotoga sp.]MDK2924175.1 peptide/nickel transport system ATP-binding protein [Pseudothermotoga sp.]HBT38930.1 peptide ABC transporter ATP-binding protein [Pseudothermotoga sp.]HCO97787.1 peptide ABC transporter ATP-binding protein [Pseudothermotoga sp.]